MGHLYTFASGFFTILILLGGLGLGVVATQELQSIRGRAAESTVSPTNPTFPSNTTSYTSNKYNYSLSYDKTLWTELDGIIQENQDRKERSFELNPQFGKATITIHAHDEEAFQSALTSPLSKGKDDLEKISSFATNTKKTILPKDVKMLETERITKADVASYKITFEKQVLAEKINYYDYIFVRGKNYYVITAKYIPTSSAIAEQFIDSFLAINSGKSIKGISDTPTKDVSFNETQITELTNPSIVNIATIYCPTIKPYIDPVYIATLSAQPIQHVKPSYTFCTGGTGSGFILTKDGNIVTSGHVAKMFPLTSFIIALTFQSDPELKQFVLDLYKQEYLRSNNKELSKEAEKKALDPKSFFSFEIQYWAEKMIKYLLDSKRLTFEDTNATKYFVKLGNNPLPIDPLATKEEKDIFRNIKETKDIREAVLVDYDYPNNDNMDVLTQKTFPKIGGDVAFIKIKNTSGLTFPGLTLADAKTIKEGNNILIIGYPGIVQGSASSSSLLNFKSSAKATITRGVISSIKEAQDGKTLLQTDATLSSGNSGGPGLDIYGNVVGISTYSYGGGFFGPSGNYNFLRSTNEITNLMKKKKLKSSNNPTYEAWQRGLSHFWNGYYRRSLEDFKTVKEAYPIHPNVDEYIADAQKAIKEGKDKDGIWGEITEVIPTWAITAISALLLILGSGGILFLIKHKKHMPQPTIPGTTIPIAPIADTTNGSKKLVFAGILGLVVLVSMGVLLIYTIFPSFKNADKTNSQASEATEKHPVSATKTQAILSSVEKKGQCQWVVRFSLKGFRPDSPITVNSKGRLSDKCDPAQTHDYEWTAPANVSIGPDGTAEVSYTQGDYGTYTYTFTDQDGNQASATVKYDLTTTPAP